MKKKLTKMDSSLQFKNNLYRKKTVNLRSMFIQITVKKFALCTRITQQLLVNTKNSLRAAREFDLKRFTLKTENLLVSKVFLI